MGTYFVKGSVPINDWLGIYSWGRLLSMTYDYDAIVIDFSKRPDKPRCDLCGVRSDYAIVEWKPNGRRLVSLSQYVFWSRTPEGRIVGVCSDCLRVGLSEENLQDAHAIEQILKTLWRLS